MSESPSPVTSKIPVATWFAIAVLVAIGAALRLPGLFTDFWLDEAWTVDIAQKISSAPQLLFSEIGRIDNNHPLNTWLIGLLDSERREPWVYRIPAFLAGVACVLVAAIAMRRRSVGEMVAAAVLTAFTFPMIFYSSEARGYTMAIFFALVAFAALLDYTRRPTWTSAIVFNTACLLGFLSHLTFVHFYLAAMFWTVLRARRLSPRIPDQLRIWARVNALPIGFCAFLYYAFVRQIRIGGSPETSALEVLIQSLSMPLGGPRAGQLSGVVAIIAGALFVFSVIGLFRKRDDLGLFYLLAVVVAPAFLLMYDRLLSEKPQPLMLRYFLVAITFLLLAIAHLAADLWRGGPSSRVMLVILACAFLGANVVRTLRFLEVGRGGYSRAVAYMISRSPEPKITVASNNTFRGKLMVDFYGSRLLPPGRSFDFYPDNPDKPHPPEFVIDDSRDAFAAVRQTADGTVYRIEQFYPAHELSGFDWRLYRIDLPETLRMRKTPD